MAKPLWRWTIGKTTDRGYDILIESMIRMVNLYGDAFDWMVCYNGVRPDDFKFAEVISEAPVQVAFLQQSWDHSPFARISPGRPTGPGGEFVVDGRNCGGTLWKFAPPRLRYNSHEIICDNDIVIFKRLKEIDQFLKSDKLLVLEDNVRFYGSVYVTMDFKLNSGLIGLPPHYDFERALRSAWEYIGSPKAISQADEQGMVAWVASHNRRVEIKNDVIVQLGATGFGSGYGYGAVEDMLERLSSDKTSGIHFVQANRAETHKPWDWYKKFRNTFCEEWQER